MLGTHLVNRGLVQFLTHHQALVALHPDYTALISWTQKG